MYWVRSALLYLLLTALLVGTIWLFWGDSVKTAFQRKNLPASAGKNPAAAVKKPAEKKIPAVPAVTQPGIKAAAEWQKTSNGFVNLLELVAVENRKDAAALAQLQENRFREFLNQMAIKRYPATPSPVSTETKVTPAQKPVRETKKPAR